MGILLVVSAFPNVKGTGRFRACSGREHGEAQVEIAVGAARERDFDLFEDADPGDRQAGAEDHGG